MKKAEAIKWLTPEDSRALIVEAVKSGIDPAQKVEEAMKIARDSLKSQTVRRYIKSLKCRIKRELEEDDYYSVETFLGIVEDVYNENRNNA